MRSDMNKIINDKVRSRQGVPSKKTAKKLDLKNLRHEDQNSESRHPESKRRQYGYDAKAHIVNDAPIKGFVKKNLGRPWDKVFSEFCAGLDPRTKTGKTMLRTIGYMVTLDCFWGVDKRLYQMNSRFGLYCECFKGFYVDPKTKRLGYYSPKPLSERERRQKLAADIWLIRLNENVYYKYHDNSRYDYDQKRYIKEGYWERHTYRTLVNDEEILDPFGRSASKTILKAGTKVSSQSRKCRAHEIEEVKRLFEEEKEHILKTGERLHSEHIPGYYFHRTRPFHELL